MSLELRLKSPDHHLVSGTSWKWYAISGLATKLYVQTFLFSLVCWLKMSGVPWSHKMEAAWVSEMLLGEKLPGELPGQGCAPWNLFKQENTW